jgi:MFS family permease
VAQKGTAFKLVWKTRRLALVAAAILSHNAGTLERRFGRRAVFLATTLVGGGGFIVMHLAIPAATILGFLSIIAAWKTRGPIVSSLMNREIPSNQRATVLSIVSFLGSALSIVLNLLIGILVERSPGVAALGIGCVVIATALVWIPVSRNR